jgi:hypothetical protein
MFVGKSAFDGTFFFGTTAVEKNIVAKSVD